jgi:hypothetical protein
MFQRLMRANAPNFFKRRQADQDFKARSADRDAETDRSRVGCIPLRQSKMHSVRPSRSSQVSTSGLRVSWRAPR